jgi:hypothetical protein
MDNLEKIIKNIPVHIKRWNAFAIIAPPIFLTAGLLLLMSDMVEFGTLFWVGITIMSVTAFTWWLWIIYTIYGLIQYMSLNNKNINNAITEIIGIRKELTKVKNDGEGTD